MDLLAFAAARSARLEEADAELLDVVREALAAWPADGWEDAVVVGASVLFLEIFEAEGGEDGERALAGFQRDLRETLLLARDGDPENDAQVERIARWVGTYSVNAATFFASFFGGERLKTWVTMGDEDVRETHVAVNGATVSISSTFDVGGSRLRFPGDPVGPPAVWINCRCLLAATPRGESTVDPETFAADAPMIDPDLAEREPDDEVESDTEGEPLVDELMPVPWHGVLAPEGVPTGDRRMFAVGALTWRDLPLPLLYQPVTDDEHKRSVVVGRIDKIWKDDNNVVYGSGMLNPNSEYFAQVVDGLLFGTIRGLSVDADAIELQAESDEDLMESLVGQGMTVFSAARIAGSTLVAIPAFQEAFVALGETPEDMRPIEYDMAEEALVASGAVFAAAAPEGAREEARRGLKWVEEGHGGDGLESATIERARKIASGAELTDEHIKRMRSFFARHAVNKGTTGWSPGDKEYPSPGRVAWALWGGDPGESFAKKEAERMKRESAAGETASFRDYSTEERKRLADEGKALPDGSYPIVDEEDLRNAIQAIGRASDPEAAKRHIIKRARDLDLTRLIPETWSHVADLLDALAAMLITAGNDLRDESAVVASGTFAPGTKDGPGWLTNPRATARIRRYWVRGKGAAKIRWGAPGDFNRCRRQLAKYVSPVFLAGTCANLHKEALGTWPGRHAVEGESLSLERAEMLSLTASGGNLLPRAWFENPQLEGPTALTVTEDGRVFGHIATWGVCHIGIQNVCTTAPKSPTNYSMFRLGYVETDGGGVAVGQITMGTGHADLRKNPAATLAHYDNTGTAIADVAAGEDRYGIWIAGALRASVSGEQRAALRAAKLSGDWRLISGALELVAVLAVNTPGFPVPRTSLAASGAEQTALVAAGVVDHEPQAAEVVDIDALALRVADVLETRSQRRARLAAAREKLGVADQALAERRKNALRALDEKVGVEI